jgi:hypothetical protein
MIGCTFFVAMLSLSTAYYQIFLSQGVGFGIAASGLFSCGIVSVGQWFHKRKALALGIVLAGSSTGIDSSDLSKCFLTCCRRRRAPYLPPFPDSKDWFCQCHASQCPRRSYRWLDILLADAYPFAEEEMGSRSQVFGLYVV